MFGLSFPAHSLSLLKLSLYITHHRLKHLLLIEYIYMSVSLFIRPDVTKVLYPSSSRRSHSISFLFFFAAPRFVSILPRSAFLHLLLLCLKTSFSLC